VFFEFEVLTDLKAFFLGEAHKFTVYKLVIWYGFGCKSILDFFRPFLQRESITLQEIFLFKKVGLNPLKAQHEKEGIFKPLKVTKHLALKVGEKFNIFIFQMGRISKKI
jgi:hypothetical protein